MGVCFVVLLAILAFVKARESASTSNYDQNGADWTGLCATGTWQSPIDIDDRQNFIHLVPDDSSVYFDLDMNYESRHAEGTFQTSTYMLIPESDHYGTITLKLTSGPDATYTAHQFHFHSPSEHSFNGHHTDLEMHIVHFTENNHLAVIALFFNVSYSEDAENEFIASVIGSEMNPSKFNLSNLLDSGVLDRFYTYGGSLTTPPCTEGVTWIVTKDILTISSDQLYFFEREWANNLDFANGKGNNRVTQALNDRVIYELDNEDDHYSILLIIAVGMLISIFL